MSARHRLAAVCLAVLAGAGAFADDAWKSPLERAKVGQWVRYDLGAPLTMKQSVTKVEGKKVTLREELWNGTTALPPVELVRDLGKKPDARARKPAEGERWSEDTVEVKRQKLHCRVWTRDTDKLWLCADVPCEGIVRLERDGKVVQELVAWGEAP